jgi:hypothetical protein
MQNLYIFPILQNLYPVLSDEKSSSSQSEVPPATCPDGLEPLQDQAVLILRENFRPDHRGKGISIPNLRVNIRVLKYKISCQRADIILSNISARNQ